jgi:hypothetical protein
VEVSIEYVPKVKNDEMADEVVNTIKTTARLQGIEETERFSSTMSVKPSA